MDYTYSEEAINEFLKSNSDFVIATPSVNGSMVLTNDSMVISYLLAAYAAIKNFKEGGMYVFLDSPVLDQIDTTQLASNYTFVAKFQNSKADVEQAPSSLDGNLHTIALANNSIDMELLTSMISRSFMFHNIYGDRTLPEIAEAENNDEVPEDTLILDRLISNDNLLVRGREYSTAQSLANVGKEIRQILDNPTM